MEVWTRRWSCCGKLGELPLGYLPLPLATTAVRVRMHLMHSHKDGSGHHRWPKKTRVVGWEKEGKGNEGGELVRLPTAGHRRCQATFVMKKEPCGEKTTGEVGLLRAGRVAGVWWSTLP